MVKHPTKIKTFFFSDIEGSTRLAQLLGESYAFVLERHRTVIRMALNKYAGREIETSGDGFFIVFDKPEQAIAASLEIQKVLSSRSWAKKLNLKVRIAKSCSNCWHIAEHSHNTIFVWELPNSVCSCQ